MNEDYYSFRFIGGGNNAYSFVTAYGVIYEVRFKPTGYIFGDAPFAPYVFEFSLLMTYKPAERIKIASDLQIPKTVISILIDFFKEESKLVSLYICDSSDFKQLVRKRKFDRWFLDYNNGDYIKSDQKLVDRDGTEFPVAIILRRDNPYRSEISDAFFELATHLNNEK